MSDSESNKELDSSRILELSANKDVDGLITALSQVENCNLIKHIIYELGELKNSKATEALLKKVVNLGKIAIRQAAIRAIGSIGDGRAVDTLIFVMVNDKDCRVTAAETLGMMKAEKAVPAMKLLLDYQHHADDEVYEQQGLESILEALGKIASEEAMVCLIEKLLTPQLSLAEKVSQVLAEIGKQAVPLLISALDNKEVKTKRMVIKVLGNITDKECTQPLLKILEDESEDSETKEEVAYALAKIKDPGAVEPLITVALRHADFRDGDYSISVCAVRALGNIGDRRAVEPLISIINDKSNPMRIRGCAADTLGKIGGNRAVERLIKVLNNYREDEWVKDCAAWALLQLDEEKIAYPLLKYLKKKKDVINMNNPIGDIR